MSTKQENQVHHILAKLIGKSHQYALQAIKKDVEDVKNSGRNSFVQMFQKMIGIFTKETNPSFPQIRRELLNIVAPEPNSAKRQRYSDWMDLVWREQMTEAYHQQLKLVLNEFHQWDEELFQLHSQLFFERHKEGHLAEDPYHVWFALNSKTPNTEASSTPKAVELANNGEYKPAVDYLAGADVKSRKYQFVHEVFNSNKSWDPVPCPDYTQQPDPVLWTGRKKLELECPSAFWYLATNYHKPAVDWQVDVKQYLYQRGLVHNWGSPTVHVPWLVQFQSADEAKQVLKKCIGDTSRFDNKFEELCTKKPGENLEVTKMDDSQWCDESCLRHFYYLLDCFENPGSRPGAKKEAAETLHKYKMLYNRLYPAKDRYICLLYSEQDWLGGQPSQVICGYREIPWDEVGIVTRLGKPRTWKYLEAGQPAEAVNRVLEAAPRPLPSDVFPVSFDPYSILLQCSSDACLVTYHPNTQKRVVYRRLADGSLGFEVVQHGDLSECPRVYFSEQDKSFEMQIQYFNTVQRRSEMRAQELLEAPNLNHKHIQSRSQVQSELPSVEQDTWAPWIPYRRFTNKQATKLRRWLYAVHTKDKKDQYFEEGYRPSAYELTKLLGKLNGYPGIFFFWNKHYHRALLERSHLKLAGGETVRPLATVGFSVCTPRCITVHVRHNLGRGPESYELPIYQFQATCGLGPNALNEEWYAVFVQWLRHVLKSPDLTMVQSDYDSNVWSRQEKFENPFSDGNKVTASQLPKKITVSSIEDSVAFQYCTGLDPRRVEIRTDFYYLPARSTYVWGAVSELNDAWVEDQGEAEHINIEKRSAMQRNDEGDESNKAEEEEEAVVGSELDRNTEEKEDIDSEFTGFNFVNGQVQFVMNKKPGWMDSDANPSQKCLDTIVAHYPSEMYFSDPGSSNEAKEKQSVFICRWVGFGIGEKIIGMDDPKPHRDLAEKRRKALVVLCQHKLVSTEKTPLKTWGQLVRVELDKSRVGCLKIAGEGDPRYVSVVHLTENLYPGIDAASALRLHEWERGNVIQAAKVDIPPHYSAGTLTVQQFQDLHQIKELEKWAGSTMSNKEWTRKVKEVWRSCFFGRSSKETLTKTVLTHLCMMKPDSMPELRHMWREVHSSSLYPPKDRRQLCQELTGENLAAIRFPAWALQDLPDRRFYHEDVVLKQQFDPLISKQLDDALMETYGITSSQVYDWWSQEGGSEHLTDLGKKFRNKDQEQKKKKQEDAEKKLSDFKSKIQNNMNTADLGANIVDTQALQSYMNDPDSILDEEILTYLSQAMENSPGWKQPWKIWEARIKIAVQKGSDTVYINR